MEEHKSIHHDEGWELADLPQGFKLIVVDRYAKLRKIRKERLNNTNQACC